MDYKLRIFIDYWNTIICGQKALGVEYFVPNWTQIPEVIKRVVNEVTQQSVVYEGCHVYASVSGAESDAGVRDFLEKTLPRFPGYDVILKERKQRSFVCPVCGERTEKSEEKGVDVALSTDLLMHGVQGSFDIAVVLSNDSDLIPAIRFISRRGKKVIHASFLPEEGEDVALSCWYSMELRRYKELVHKAEAKKIKGE